MGRKQGRKVGSLCKMEALVWASWSTRIWHFFLSGAGPFLLNKIHYGVRWLEASIEAAPLVGIQVEKKLWALEALDQHFQIMTPNRCTGTLQFRWWQQNLFWQHPWMERISLECKFRRLFRVALNPNGSVSDHWDSSTSSWSIFSGRLLNDKKILDFQSLLSQLSTSQTATYPDRRFWSLETNGSFSVILG